jgi:type III pantothenate kinase
MLLVVDIGNTNVVLGIYDGPVLKAHWRLATDAKTTADEYGILFTNLLTSAGLVPAQTSGAIMSCVVPTLTATFETLIEQYFRQQPLIVTSESDTGLTIRYPNPKEIGSDRLVNAAAAYHKYRRDLIIVDFGTATTFCAVTKEAEYLGGVIAPGLGISAEALFARAAKLSNVALTSPKTVSGTDPGSSIQSGLLFGYAGLVDTLVRRIEQELGRSAYVIATGGLSNIIAKETTSIQTIEPLLTLEGLALLYRRATGGSPILTWV